MTSLSVTDLSFSYAQKDALKGVSFAVEKGQFCALLGPNGAGKSTLYGLLTGLLATRSGTIRIGEADMARAPRQALAQMGVVFQQTTLDLDLTVTQNLRYFAALHGLSGKEASLRIDAALDRLEMRERSHEKVRALNGGHKRRTEIARALLHKPSVMLLDEPTVGLDAPARASITRHVHDLCRDEGLTVLWATHLTDEVLPDDHLVVLHQGQIRFTGTARDFSGTETLQNAFLDAIGVAR